MRTARIRRTLRKIAYALETVYLLPVYIYRRFISPLKPTPVCRFRPTCSAYATEAVREWGIIIGTLLTLWRLIRCNPFCKGGYDPVPKAPWKR